MKWREKKTAGTLAKMQAEVQRQEDKELLKKYGDTAIKHNLGKNATYQIQTDTTPGYRLEEKIEQMEGRIEELEEALNEIENNRDLCGHEVL